MDELTSSTPSVDTTPAPAESQSESYSTPTDTSYSEPQNSSTESQPIASASDSNGTRFELVEENGRRTLKAVKATEPTVQTQQENVQAGEPQYTSQEKMSTDVNNLVNRQTSVPEMYTLNEFSNALASGNVDEARIPQQYQEQYIKFRTDQAIKEFNARVKAEQEQKAQIAQQLTPEQKAQNMQEFYEALEKEASRRAVIDAQLTDEDIEDLEYMADDDEKKIRYNRAINWHRQDLTNELQRKAAEDSRRQDAQRQVYEGVAKFVQETRASEPHFNEIDIMMKTHYQTMRYDEAVKYNEAIQAMSNGTLTPKQSEVLLDYYKRCRADYYAQKNGVSTTPRTVARPAQVERPGNGADVSAPPPTDFRILRGKTGKERRAILAQYLKNGR